MIFVSVLLALFQIYSMAATGRRDKAPTAASVVAAAPRAVLAVAAASTPPMAAVAASAPPPKSCYRQYQAKFQHCGPADRACHLNTADQWDLCEATGVWPN
ncbi:MAG: hypothetical protein ACRCS5_10930 [Sphingomonas sp.]